MKKPIFEEDDYTPCCALCEHAQLCGDGLFLCLLKKRPRETPAAFTCRRYSFDILKYNPAPHRKKPIDEADYPSLD